jgi:hypothetical protein
MTRLTFDEMEAFARDLGRPDDPETMYREPSPSAKAALDELAAMWPYAPQQQPPQDAINPEHYKVGGIEAIDYMRAKSSEAEFTGYLRLSALKYLSRAGHKDDALQDYKKAHWFISRLIEELEK